MKMLRMFGLLLLIGQNRRPTNRKLGREIRFCILETDQIVQDIQILYKNE